MLTPTLYARGRQLSSETAKFTIKSRKFFVNSRLTFMDPTFLGPDEAPVDPLGFA